MLARNNPRIMYANSVQIFGQFVAARSPSRLPGAYLQRDRSICLLAHCCNFCLSLYHCDYIQSGRLTATNPLVKMYFAENWSGKEGIRKLLPSMANLTILTASATLLGPEVRQHLFKEVSEL